MTSSELKFLKQKLVTTVLTFLCPQEIDMGQYVCTVSAWSVNSQGDMVKTAEHQSSPLTVQWVTKRKENVFICPSVITTYL